MRLSINEILSSKWMKNDTKNSSSFPTNKEVIEYMTEIKLRVEEHEKQQLINLDQTLLNKTTTTKAKLEEAKDDNSGDDNLNDSVLSS